MKILLTSPVIPSFKEVSAFQIVLSQGSPNQYIVAMEFLNEREEVKGCKLYTFSDFGQAIYRFSFLYNLGTD